MDTSVQRVEDDVEKLSGEERVEEPDCDGGRAHVNPSANPTAYRCRYKTGQKVWLKKESSPTGAALFVTITKVFLDGNQKCQYKLEDGHGNAVETKTVKSYGERALTTSEAQNAMEEGRAGIMPTSPTTTSTSRTATALSSGDIEKQDPSQYTPEANSNKTYDSRRGIGASLLFSLQKRFGAFHRSQNISPTVRKINSHPQGFPNLAAFLDSHENFMVYRRFGYLQSRLLLQKQYELCKLQEMLDQLDRDEAIEDPGIHMSRDNESDARKTLMGRIEERVKSYAEALTTAQNLMSFHRPSSADYFSVGNYIKNRKPLFEGEDDWILEQEDMITLRGAREHAWLDDVVEGCLRIIDCKPIRKIFISKQSLEKSEDCLDSTGNRHEYEKGCEVYYTPSRIANFSNGILVMFILFLLITPIWIMYHMIHNVGTDRAYVTCIGVMIVATLAFSSVVAVFTKARRHEMLAAAAAYCAVLVVFFGNVGNRSQTL